MSDPVEHPAGIIITISEKMLREKGVMHWTRNYLDAMQRNAAGEDILYYMRQGACPKRDKDLLYVYLCIGGQIRYRSIYAGSLADKTIKFTDGKEMYAKAWIILGGPADKPPFEIKMKGFRGFRYTTQLW